MQVLVRKLHKPEAPGNAILVLHHCHVNQLTKLFKVVAQIICKKRKVKWDTVPIHPVRRWNAPKPPQLVCILKQMHNVRGTHTHYRTRVFNAKPLTKPLTNTQALLINEQKHASSHSAAC